MSNGIPNARVECCLSICLLAKLLCVPRRPFFKKHISTLIKTEPGTTNQQCTVCGWVDEEGGGGGLSLYRTEDGML